MISREQETVVVGAEKGVLQTAHKNCQPAVRKMRDGEVVGPDGYTNTEREYMKGAGIDPSQPAPG